MAYSVYDVYHSQTDSPASSARLIYQTWSMAGCEQHVDWYVKNGVKGFYWYGPHDPKYKWKTPVSKLLQRMPTWELCVVREQPTSLQS